MNNRRYFSRRTLLLLFVLSVVFHSSSLLGVNWSIVPLGFNFNPSPGDTLTNVLTVRNSGDIDEELIIYIKDIQYDADGNGKELEPGNIDRGLAKWTDIFPERLTVKAGENKQVRFTISIPEEIDSGSYWANMYEESVNNPTLMSKNNREGREVSIFSNIRYKINLNATVTGDYIKSGEITNIEVIPNEIDTLLVIHTTFENIGDVILRCNGRIEIRDEMGETVETLSLGDFKTYPQCIRVLKKIVPSSLMPGEYSALAVIDYGGDYLIAGEAFFEVDNKDEQTE